MAFTSILLWRYNFAVDVERISCMLGRIGRQCGVYILMI